MESILSLRSRGATLESLRVAVDLSALPPGGAIEGLKTPALSYLKTLVHMKEKNLTFVFLTCSSSHAEVRSIAQSQDELVCVRDEKHLSDSTNVIDRSKGEMCFLNQAANLLLRLGVQVLYSPLGPSKYICPEIPTISMVIDVLHRDYPSSLLPEQIAEREANFAGLVRSASKLQCASEYTAKRMSTLYGLLDSRLFRCYPVVASPSPGTSDQNEPSESLPYFFYPADAARHQNHETLLIAYRLYREQTDAKSWDLVLAGKDDAQMQMIRETVGTLGLSQNVRFSNNTSTALWRSAGALVFPSLHEGFGATLLDAMHFNCAILCSEAGALPEVARDAALYADATDVIALARQMTRVASDASLRAELVERGQRRLTDFHREQQATELLSKLRGCASTEKLPIVRGLYPDGWIERQAIIALPSFEGIRRVDLSLASLPVARQVIVSLGLVRLRIFDLKAGEPHKIRLDIHLDGVPLVLDVPDACNLNPADRRTHGVALKSISLFDSDGHQSELIHIGI